MGAAKSYLMGERKENKDMLEGWPRRNRVEKGKFPFTNLCIEGGGARGVALGGTIRALDEYGILSQLKQFVGSSAGAIGCTMIAAGYGAHEVHELNMNTDFNLFMDDSWGVVRDSNRFISRYGMCPGDFFQTWIEDLLLKKIGIASVTFQQLFNVTGNDLRITSVCVSDDKLVIFTHKSHPYMQVSLAVRASMSIPGVFCPVEIDGKLYVDGGLSDNYPLDTFDDEFVDDHRTLGLKLMGDEETRGSRIHVKPLPTNNVVEYYGAIISHMCNSIERLKVNKKYWPRTIQVPTGTIGTTEFTMSQSRKLAAVDVAYKSTVKQLEYFKEHREFKSTDANSQ